MFRNESNLDRSIRGGVGALAVIGALLVGASSALGLLLLAVAAILVVTAAVGFCPLYRVLGIRTDKASSKATFQA